MPAWWLFEIINWRTGNWEYLGAGTFTPLEYYALCTLSFSTVMPAVFETAELVRTFRWVKSLPAGMRVPDTSRVGLGLLLTGLVMLALTLAWPKFFYPLVWISLVFIFEPVNRRLGRPHFLAWLQARRLATGDFAVARGADLRVLLGDVELLVPGRNGFITPRARSSCTCSKCPCWDTAATSRLPWSFTR